jgi:hypothetical protein
MVGGPCNIPHVHAVDGIVIPKPGDWVVKMSTLPNGESVWKVIDDRSFAWMYDPKPVPPDPLEMRKHMAQMWSEIRGYFLSQTDEYKFFRVFAQFLRDSGMYPQAELAEKHRLRFATVSDSIGDDRLLAIKEFCLQIKRLNDPGQVLMKAAVLRLLTAVNRDDISLKIDQLLHTVDSGGQVHWLQTGGDPSALPIMPNDPKHPLQVLRNFVAMNSMNMDGNNELGGIDVISLDDVVRALYTLFVGLGLNTLASEVCSWRVNVPFPNMEDGR